MTDPDKQKAVRAALLHPKGAGLSDSQIAGHVGVDDKTVAKYRAELEAASEIPKVTERVGADGKVYDTTNIGSEPPKAAQEALARRKEIYLALHPETKQGACGRRGSGKGEKVSKNDNLSFSEDTAARTGKSRRTVERDRRHLTASQRAQCAAEVATLKRGGDRKSEDFKGQDCTSIDGAAKAFNVSARSVKTAKHVADKGDPAVVQAVKANRWEL